MGFPIKRRINCANHRAYGPAPCGPDLLSTAIDARPVPVAQPASLGRSQSQGTIAPCSTRRASGGDSEESSAAPEPAPSSSLGRPSRFPAVLRDILSDPEHESVVSWLPHGRSFAVHDVNAFSSEVLPKYFRKVVFRSFARKLNRWGFRSVLKSISGFENTFEHNLFRRDEPELSRGMRCSSNPATAKGRAAVADGQTRAAGQTQAIPTHPVPLQVQAPGHAVPLQTLPAQTHTQRPVIPSSSGAAGTAGVAPQVPRTAAPIAAASAPRGSCNEVVPAVPVRSQGQEAAVRALRNSLEEELAVRLRDELVVRKQRSREREILQFLRETHVSQSDAASWYIAEELRRRMLAQLRGHGGYWML